LAPGKELNVAMGGGRREFYGAGNKGHRLAHNADLISPWLEAVTNRVYVETAAQLTTLGLDTRGWKLKNLPALSKPPFPASIFRKP
jgi:alkaline phosphatase